jgi:hypothetical protein
MITSPNVEGANDLTNSSRGSGTPTWLYHAGPTMVARAWPKPSPRQLEDSLPVLLLHLGGSLMNGWMWRPAEAETIYRQAPRAKGEREPGPEWAGSVGRGRPAQAHFSPVRPRFPPRLLLT